MVPAVATTLAAAVATTLAAAVATTLAAAFATELAVAARLESAQRWNTKERPGLPAETGAGASERGLIGNCALVFIIFGNTEKRY